MFNIHSLLGVVSAFAIASALASPKPATPDTAFSRILPRAMAFAGTCEDIQVIGSILVAKCDNNYGAMIWACLNLDECMWNAAGKLVAGSTGYFESCVNCGFSGTNVTCLCGVEVNGIDTYNSTSIDINTFVGNRDGTLICAED